MAFMFGERNGKTTIDYPIGGSKAIVDALIRGARAAAGRRGRAGRQLLWSQAVDCMQPRRKQAQS